MNRYLRRIKDDLIHQLQHKQLLQRNADQMYELLNHLPPIEKQHLCKYFCATAWNVGHPHVIGLLQRAHILTMTEYICHQPNGDDNDSYLLSPVQHIFDDLLESDPHLLANLVQCMGDDTMHTIRVTELLTEGVARVFHDLNEQPNAIARNYLRTIGNHLSNKQFESFRLIHVQFLLNDPSSQSSVTEAFGKQTTWNAAAFPKNYHENPPMLLQLLAEMCHDCTTGTLSKLLDAIRAPGFAGWQWYLRLLRTIVAACNESHLTIVRQFLRDMFKLFLQQRCDHLLYVVLLTARQVCAYATVDGQRDRFGSYFTWYKATLGEMQYTHTVDEFKIMMQALIRSVRYEQDATMVDVHVRTAIAAPPLCSDLVHSFKQLSRSHLMQLQTLKAGDDDDVRCPMTPDDDFVLL